MRALAALRMVWASAAWMPVESGDVGNVVREVCGLGKNLREVKICIFVTSVVTIMKKKRRVKTLLFYLTL